ncbi:unnamed protein product [Mytilus edulis]|uniref:MAM domain-containing protein n=1 Tax=Mytilus edulis TaxID=6550 RepID=A0A8S3UKC8_MYTED|nr:unnamed protein product [Mytilus edulis]
MMLFTLELLILLVINVNTISGIVNSSCTFESGQCGWSVNGKDRYKWKRQRGNARHSSTGPDKDHTTSSENGYYFCTVSNSHSKENDVSDLHSGLINQCPKQFLTFWYHMNGKNIDTLKVFQVKNARLIELWRTAANQGNNWQYQSLSLDEIGPYQIMFRATRGKRYKSKIAVDDIFINNTECKKDLVVGLVIGGLLLLCVITVIVVLIKRQSLKSRPRETIKNNSGEYDYIESHDLAFPLTANHSSHIPNDGTHSNTAYPGRRNTTLSDNPTLSDQTYSIVDQTPESTLNKTRDDGKGTTDSYMVLDPTATGFNRTTLPNTRSDCEFAKPVIVTGNSIGDEDQYALSEEGCYDHSGNNRHKELEVNIYNHAVDTIYDSGSHTRKEAGRDDTYDHFLGQKKEDGNDI